MKRAAGVFRPLQAVDKVCFCALCRKGLAEFRRPQTAEEDRIVFSGGVYVGKHSSQAASVRAKASARGGLRPLEKMPAFLRSVSKFFDTLRATGIFRPLSRAEGCNSSISVFTADRTAYGGSPETLWETAQRQFSRRSTPFGFFQPSASPVSQCRADPQGHKTGRIEQQRKRDRRTGRPPYRLFVQPLRQNDRPLRNWLLSPVYAESGHLCLFFSPVCPVQYAMRPAHSG